MQKPNPILGPMRLPFLILAPICAFLAISVIAYQTPASLSVLKVGLVIIGAISAHISVNTFNEYFDFRSGLDLKTIKTPFSGGSGALPASPDKARIALLEGNISSAVVATHRNLLYGHFDHAIAPPWNIWSGDHHHLYHLAEQNSLPVPDSTWYRVWIDPCDRSGLALSGTFTNATLVLASLIPFFLVNNLLLLNQFPDVDADKAIGRLHYPILIGRKNSAIIYRNFQHFNLCHDHCGGGNRTVSNLDFTGAADFDHLYPGCKRCLCPSG